MTSRILCTHPGKFGDLLWALPTIRAISRWVGEPVDLLLAAELRSIVPLLQKQDYLANVNYDGAWETLDTAPRSPRIPAFPLDGHEAVIHLGYREWPTPDVVQHTWNTAVSALAPDAMLEAPDLSTPWISAHLCDAAPGTDIAVGFTDEHFELKLGVYSLVHYALQCPRCELVGTNLRWQHEGNFLSWSWQASAYAIAHAKVFLGCCSALHVLAVAVGTPAVLMEPNSHRHNDVFYPLGKTGPQVQLVTGTDGQPTFDSRHVLDTLRPFLESSR